MSKWKDENLVIVHGRLTRDPEFKVLDSGMTICNFSIANNRGNRKGSEEELPANFFDCVAWGKTAELVANNFDKGRKIAIRGELVQDRWQDRDGGNRSKVKVTVFRVDFMDSRRTDGQPAGSAPAPRHGDDYGNGHGETELKDDEIPF